MRALGVLCLCVLPVGAQEFGQNKVRYQTYDFKVMKTPNFDVYYYDQESVGATDAGRMAERWRARHGRVLDWQLSPDQPVILYGNHIAFSGTTVIPGFIGEGTGGVTEAIRRRVVMPLAGALGETDHVLGHELVHAYQYDMAEHAGPKGGAGLPGIMNMPLWFIEGMAEYLSVGANDPLTAMWMRDAVRREKIPAIKDLENPKYFPYRYGQALWAYIGGRYGNQVIGQILRKAGALGRVDTAIRGVLGISTDDLSKQWRQALIEEYEPVLKVTTPPTAVAKQVIAAKPEEGNLNVGPVLSPDGSKMMIYSSAGLFSIDIYLADANTGRLEKHITNTAVDPHIDTLQFINSAGAWSADGNRFVYPDVANGRPRLSIYDMKAGRTTQHIPVADLGEVVNPTWSPDGGRIAFSGVLGGLTDLYVVNVDGGKLRRFTTDQFADLQPAWSPDGRTIAFVTDRFTSNLQNLSSGKYRIGLLDTTTGDIRQAPGFENANQTNPQWSADGNSLFFISDRDGIFNIYRTALAGGRIAQLTNLHTGVSGITALSPAMSVAGKTNRIAFTSFSGGSYGVFIMEPEKALGGEAPTTVLAGLNAGLLPPVQRDATVATLLERPNVGLVSQSSFTSKPYHARLSLDYIAPPSIGVGLSNYGAMAGGGTALYFSDLLGYHNLMTAIQTTTTTEGAKLWNSLSGMVAYENDRHRWTWGLVGGQSPFLSAGYGEAVANVDGRQAVVQQSVLFWQIDRQAAVTWSYPFSRAQRVEFAAGFENISFDQRTEAQAFDPVTGQLLAVQTQNGSPFPALNMGTASAAMVYDTSVFGGTSPVAGQRWRIGLDGSRGSLNYYTPIVDYRRYLRIARPLSLAIRTMHFGRYGGGSNDQRVQSLFLGYGAFIRGYNPNSFSPQECGPSASTTGTCPVFDQLIGSRVAVGNAELRIPILGALGVIPSRHVPPVEFAPFYDAGVAWNRHQPVPHHAVRSYGASLRINVLGYAVAQISFVHPMDRPSKHWVWQFDLIPGF